MPGGGLLYEQRWLPKGPLSAVVAIVHGFAEHSGRYARHANRLNDAGFAVEAIDLHGHGKSSGRKGYIPSAASLVDDVATFVDRVRARPQYENLPLFLLGHSLGATLVGLASLTKADVIRGLVMCSPAIRIGEPKWLQAASTVASHLVPRLPTKRLNLNLLSTDPVVVEEAREDPLYYHGLISIGTAAQIIRAGKQLLDSGAQLRLPMLIIHGTEDRLTLAVASAQLYRRCRSNNKSLSLFRGMRHETFNEVDGKAVLDRIVDFLEEQIAEPDAPTS